MLLLYMFAVFGTAVFGKVRAQKGAQLANPILRAGQIASSGGSAGFGERVAWFCLFASGRSNSTAN
jgi:hypothetical protein